MTIDGGSVEIRFEGNVIPLRRSVEEAVETISEVTEAADRADSAVSDSMSRMAKGVSRSFEDFSENAGQAFVKLVDQAEEAAGSIKSIGSALSSIGLTTLTAGATAATGALVSLTKKGIQATDFLETSRVAMSGLTGSIAEGNKAMSLAANYWQNNPFQRIDVTNATKQLVQFGRTTKDISGDLEILGNVSLSTNMNIADLARYYARVSSSGRAMTQDLEMMSDRGVPIYRELEKQLHTTTEGVRKLASEGKISFEIFRKAMEGAVSEEAMAQYEDTLARQTDRLKGSIQIIAGELAGYKIINDQLVISEDGLEKAWTRLIKTVATGLRSDSMKKAMESIGNALAKLVDTITKYAGPAIEVLSKVIQFLGEHSALLIPIFGFLMTKISGLASQIPFIGGIISKFTGGFGNLYDTIKNFVSLNPALTAILTVFGTGFYKAFKNSEEFRNTFKSIGQSLQSILNNLMDAFKGVFDVIVQIVQSLAESGVIQGILQGVATALAWIAKAIASIPPETLATLISFFLTLKVLKANPIYLVAAGIALLISKIQELGGIGKFLEKLPEMLSTIGNNMMTGLVKGIQEGATKVINFIKDVGRNIVTSLKNILGIHSPSTVMYGIGENICLGLANGIEDNKSAVQLAMDNLAKDILSLGSKVIQNKVDFGVIDIKGQYQEWKKFSRMFTQGSEQYNTAIEKMEDARKQANLKILDLQQSYNDALDETIDKIAKMYGLFDDVNLQNTTNSSKILKTLDKQVAKMQEWAEAQEIIANSGLDAGLIEELQEMGVSSTAELSAIASMTADELATLNEMWLKKQAIANDAGVKQMKNLKDETLNQINDLKNGIDGVTVDVTDIGGRLVSSISEGVYGAMPTLQSAFSQLGDYIEKARRQLKQGGDGYKAPDTPDAGDLPETLKDELTGMAQKVKDMLPNILLGVLGAVGVFKIGPKVIKWLSKKLLGGGEFSQGLAGILQAGLEGTLGKSNISQLLGKLPYGDEGFLANVVGKLQQKLEGSSDEIAKTATKTAKNMKTATQPVESIAQSSTSIGKGMETAGKGMSKVDSFLNTIIKGALAVVAIAGAIAAMAGALWLTYNLLKDIDFLKLAEQLGVMVIAVAAMGTLAWAAEKLDIGVKGILVIAGIAADIAVVALAIRAAYELMRGIDFVGYQLVIVEMIESLAVFGGFAALFGIFAELEALGLLVIAGIAADVALVALACRSAYDNMKDIDFGKFQYVILEMIEAIGAMGGFGAILGLLAPLEFLGWASILMICDELIKVSKALWIVYNVVPDDFDKVKGKIDLIKSVLNKIIDTDLGSLIGAIVSAIEAGPLERTIDMYVHVAEQLNKLSNISLDEGKINTNLDLVKAALEKVRSKTGVISAVLQSWADEANANSVQSAGRVITIYGEIVDTLDKLSNVTINDSVLTGVTKLTEFVQKVLDTISKITTNWWVNVGSIEQTIGLTESILNKFSEIIPTIHDKIQDSKIDKDKAIKQIDAVTDIVYHIGKINEAGGIENKEKIVGYTESILNKFTEMVPTIEKLSNMSLDPTTAVEKVASVRNLVYEIGKINQAGGIENKEKIVGYTQSILNKFTELVPTIKQLESMGLNTESATNAVRGVRNLVYEIGQINTESGAKNLKTKSEILDVTQSLINKFTEIAPVIQQLTNIPIGEKAVEKVQTVRHLVWELGEINTQHASSLATKEWVVGMAASIAYKLGEFTQALSTIGNSSSEAATSAINAMNLMFNSVATDMSGSVVVFENLGIQIGQKLAQGMNSQIPTVAQAGYSLQNSLWFAIESKMADEYYQGQWMATQFGNGLRSVDFNSIGASMQSSLWWAIQNRMNDEYYQGQTMGYRFRQGLYDVDYGNAGWWAVKGFENGAWALYGSVYNTGWWIANNFLQGLKDRGRQGSPWKTTIESGSWAVEGLIEGMKDSEDALVSEATTLADEVVDTLTMDNLTLSPSLDATTSSFAPSMADGEYGIIGSNGREVLINQTNEVYTDLDMEQVNRDLAWQLSKV